MKTRKTVLLLLIGFSVAASFSGCKKDKEDPAKPETSAAVNKAWAESAFDNATQ